MTKFETPYETDQRDKMKEVINQLYQNLIAPMRELGHEVLVTEIELQFTKLKEQIDMISPEHIGTAVDRFSILISDFLSEVAEKTGNAKLTNAVQKHRKTYQLDDIEMPEGKQDKQRILH